MAELIFKPRTGTNVTLGERYKKFQFGMGYQQRQKLGINSLYYNVSCTFQFSETGRTTINDGDSTVGNTHPLLSEWIAFFADHGYSTPFDFDCPGIGKKTFIMNSCSAPHLSGDVWEISVELETYNLASPLP